MKTTEFKIAVTAAYVALAGGLISIVVFVLSVTGGLGSDII
jgi:hypothetical protein